MAGLPQPSNSYDCPACGTHWDSVQLICPQCGTPWAVSRRAISVYFRIFKTVVLLVLAGTSALIAGWYLVAPGGIGLWEWFGPLAGLALCGYCLYRIRSLWPR